MRTKSQYTFKERYELLQRIGINKPTKDMVWRVDDAIEMNQAGLVKLADDTESHNHRFRVHSQSDPNQVYHTDFNDHQEGFCTCPDWKKHDLEAHQSGIPFSFWHCKHVIAARLFDYEQKLRESDIDVQAALDELEKLESERNALVDQIDDLKRKADQIGSTISHIKYSVKAHMDASNQRRIETPYHTVYIASLPTRVAVRRYDDVPEEFRVTRTEHDIDKGAIARHIRDTGEIPSGVDVLSKAYIKIKPRFNGGLS